MGRRPLPPERRKVTLELLLLPATRERWYQVGQTYQFADTEAQTTALLDALGGAKSLTFELAYGRIKKLQKEMDEMEGTEAKPSALVKLAYEKGFKQEWEKAEGDHEKFLKKVGSTPEALELALDFVHYKKLQAMKAEIEKSLIGE